MIVYLILELNARCFFGNVLYLKRKTEEASHKIKRRVLQFLSRLLRKSERKS